MVVIMSIQRRQILAWASLALAGCGGDSSQDVVAPADLANDTPAVASYRLTLSSYWTAAIFPTQFPPTAHLTGIVGATHGSGVDFWSVGSPASRGVKDVAERGDKLNLLAEVDRAIAAGTAEFVLSGDGVPLGDQSVSLTFTASVAHPRVTLISMLGPSPDWFTGVAGVALLDNGLWLPRLQLPLRVYDAGTDDGATFLAANAVTVPPIGVQPLSTLVGDSDLAEGIHRTSGQMLASLLFERLS